MHRPGTSRYWPSGKGLVPVGQAGLRSAVRLFSGRRDEAQLPLQRGQVAGAGGHFAGAGGPFRRGTPVQPHNVGDKGDSRLAEVAQGAVHLAVDVAGVDEQHRLLARAAELAPVQKPEGAGQGHGQEKVGTDGDHHVHGFGLDQLLTNLQLGLAGVAGGVGHHKAGPAALVEGAVENLDPEVVGVVGAGQPEGETGVVLEAVFVHVVDVEGGIGHHEVEPAQAAVQVLVVGVALDYLALQAVDGQVHPGQADGPGGLLLAVEADLAAGVFAVAGHELGALDKHAAAATGRVQDFAVIRLDDLHDQFDQGGGGEELAAALAFGLSELAQEVLVNFAKDIALDIRGDVVEDLEQGAEGGVFQVVVGLGQDAFKLGVMFLDQVHGLVDFLADRLAFGQVEQGVEAGLRGQVKRAGGLVTGRAFREAQAAAGRGLLRRLGLELVVDLAKLDIGVAQKDQPQDGGGVFVGAQPRVGPQLIGGAPEMGFELGIVNGQVDTSLPVE